LAIKLYNEHLGAQRLAARVESPVFDTTLEGRGVSCLDVVASRSADGSHVFINAVNTDPTRPLTTEIQLSSLKVAPTAKLECVTAASLSAANGFSTPDSVSTSQSDIKAGSAFQVELAARSISVITLAVEN